MKAAAIASWSPLEVGDTVMIRGWDTPVEVTEIETVYSASRNETVIKHYFDGWMLPLERVECRVVDGKRVRIGDEMTMTEEVC